MNIYTVVAFFFITAPAWFAGLSAPAKAADWPANAGVEIGRLGESDGLPEDFEPSGAVWHPVRQKLIVVDDSGLVSQLDPDGGGVTTWNVGGDLEGVTIADPDNDLVYLAIEQPDAVVEFNLATGLLTGNEWDLTPWLQGRANSGLEALTFVDGHFYAGLQEDGNIFVFNLLAGGVVQHLSTITSHGGRDDISGLHYDACAGILFAIHDSHDVIVEMAADGTFLREYELAGDHQEGIAIVGGDSSGQTTIFIAEDAGEVWRYEQYPTEGCAPAPVETGHLLQQPSWLNCSPNPFNPTAELRLRLNTSQHVERPAFFRHLECVLP